MTSTRTSLMLGAATALTLALAGCASAEPDTPPADDAAGTSSATESAADAPADETETDDAAAEDDAEPAVAVPAAMDFTAPTVAGGELDVAALAGEPTVFWFWAPWCTICRGEAPDVAQVAEDLDGEVTVVGVAGLGETDAMVQFVDDTGVDGFENVIDEDGSIWNGFGVVSQPSYVFVNANGESETVVGALGYEALDEAARDLVDG